MVAEKHNFEHLLPANKFHKMLDSNQRADNRPSHSYRNIVINDQILKNSMSSSIVKIGNSTFICAINAYIEEPFYKDKKPFGKFEVFLSSSQGEGKKSSLWDASNYFNKIHERLVVLSQRIKDIFLINKIVDLSKLVINDKFCWCLYADIFCYEADGNIFDTAFYSILRALKTLKLPLLNSSDLMETISFNEKNLNFFDLDIPRVYSVSFAIIRNLIIVDPTGEEENIADFCCTLVYDFFDRKIAFYTNGRLVHFAVTDILASNFMSYSLIPKLEIIAKKVIKDISKCIF